MRHTYDCPMRWADMDMLGHVNNVTYIDYLQEARVAFLRSGAASELLDEGVVVVSHQVEYRRPIDYSDDGVHVALGVSALGGSRLELAYELRQLGVSPRAEENFELFVHLVGFTICFLRHHA